MADFDDAADPELGAACNRLASWLLPLPVGGLIDPVSGLTEPDVVRILRRLYATRREIQIPIMSMDEAARRYGRPPEADSKED